jgi:light-regulated signal transduction histidine kinase (bacteriophytochrome)
MFEGVLAGALSMGSDQVGYFTAEQIDITRSIANQLGIALQQADLRQRIAEQAAELERRVVERTAQLEAANHDLEAFSYTVSHDLRSPLRAIDGFSRMLEAEHANQLDADGLRFLEAIRKNGERMAALIDDLLRFAQTGRDHISRAVVDMEALARESWAEAVGSSGTQLRMQALPQAFGDRALLKQVWLNLLTNAVKYSAKKPDPQVEVSASEGEGEIVYCVKDNGAGFDMRYYDKLFGVFQRLHSSREFSGTGVGLAIVQRVISRHGGHVRAESVLEQGASFYFSLPAPRQVDGAGSDA